MDSLLSCSSVALASIPRSNILQRRWVHCKCRSFTGAYLHAVNVHLQSLNLMVGRLVGWFMYFWLCQTECQCSRIQWVHHVLHHVHCTIWFSLWLNFLFVGSVHHAQYKKSCIWVSILNPIFLVAYCWNRLCLLFGKKIVFCPWISVHS